MEVAQANNGMGAKIAAIAGWVWCGFLVALALGSLASGSIVPMLIIGAAAVVASPWAGSHLRPRGVPGAARVVASVVLMFVGVLTSPDIKKAPENNQHTTAAQPAAAPPATAPDTKAALAAQTRALWQSVVDDTKQCDSAWSIAAKAMSAGNPYNAYAPTKAASEVCQQAGTDIKGIEVPAAAEGDTKDRFSKAIDDCGNAYMMGGLAFDKMLTVIDGDARPSVVNDAKEMMEAAGAGKLMCAAGVMDAAQRAGVPMDTFAKTKG
ncbi:hypothetical protein [Sphingomonas oryzagri]